MKWQQTAAYQALLARMAVLDVPTSVGPPASAQNNPLAYIRSSQIVFDERYLTQRLRPVLTVAVKMKENDTSEWTIIDLVDRVGLGLMDEPLDGVCRARVEAVTYDWRMIGGVEHRVADLQLILSLL